MSRQSQLQCILAIAILITLNFVGAYVHEQWDLTEERRYTLTQATTDLVESQEEVIYVKVLLSGDLPAGFKRLQRSTGEMLRQFRRKNNLVHFEFDDPQSGSTQERNARVEELAKDGIIPTRLRVRDAGEAKEQLIYPYALFYLGNKLYTVNLLENERPGVDNELILNNSIGLLEYKFANAIQKLNQSTRANIIFTAGNGELLPLQTRSLESELRRHYNTARIDLDTVLRIPQEISLVIIAKPTERFSDKELFVLDQYVVNGGNVIFLIDQLDVGLDSMSQTRSYVPQAYDLNLAPMLFKYGARVQPNLVLDLECTRIPLVVGRMGDRVQTELFPWYYHVLVTPRSDHPIVKNIDLVNMYFPSSIDTLQSKAQIRKTTLLQSSGYSRIQRVPVRLTFEVLRSEPDPELFDQAPQALAVLLEGRQISLFENRISPEVQQMLNAVGSQFQAQNAESKILVVSDGDIAKNLYETQTGEVRDLGYNQYENFVFRGNQSLLLNTVEYMLDQHGILTARSKEVKLRMLDAVRVREEALKWQLLNIVVPIVVILIGAWSFNLWRRRRYGK